ncbi:hypothetical protein RUND412_002982 [Rhizina undulata]
MRVPVYQTPSLSSQGSYTNHDLHRVLTSSEGVGMHAFYASRQIEVACLYLYLYPNPHYLDPKRHGCYRDDLANNTAKGILLLERYPRRAKGLEGKSDYRYPDQFCCGGRGVEVLELEHICEWAQQLLGAKTGPPPSEKRSKKFAAHHNPDAITVRGARCWPDLRSCPPR